MRRAVALLSAVSAGLLLAGCPDGEELDLCGPAVEKRALADLLYQWYLYPEVLPQVVDTSLFPTTQALLEHMTATAQSQGRDRGWTFLTTAAEATSLFQEGEAVGFGLSLLTRDPDVFVSQVYPGSAAAQAGFRRGDRLLRIGETTETLAAVTPQNVGTLLGPATAGVTRHFEVARGAGTVALSATKRTFGLDPMPVVGAAGERWKIVERNGRRLGYVALRTFVATADPLLGQAFQAFAAAGVTDVVVDLRYNGGGLVSTGELLTNLLGGGISGTMTSTRFNSRRAANDSVTPFAPPAGALPATRLAFITTGASASASELVPNALEPYKGGALALVGARTHGKPVGQVGFRLRNCESVAYVVAFKIENAQGDGEYFDGLPDVPAAGDPAFAGPLCGADDDLSREPGDEAEASTAAALAFLETGACPAPPAAIAKPGLRAARGPDAYPSAPAPTLAQRHVNGLF